MGGGGGGGKKNGDDSPRLSEEIVEIANAYFTERYQQYVDLSWEPAIVARASANIILIVSCFVRLASPTRHPPPSFKGISVSG